MLLKALPCLALLSLASMAWAQSTANLHWRAVPLPANLQAADFRSVEFPSHGIGVAVGSGGAVARTTDSGLTWTRISLGGDTATLRQVDFIGEVQGLAAGGLGAIYYTFDAGLTWKKASGVPAVALEAVAFQDYHVAWACGPRGVLLRSADAGVTWSAFDHGLGPANFRSIDFQIRAGTTSGYGAIAGDSAFLAHTPDTGRTWARSTWDGERKEVHFHRVAFTRDFGVAVVLGRPGSIWSSHNSGRTWTSGTWNVTPHPFLDYADNSSEAVVVGAGGIFRRGSSGTGGWYGGNSLVYTRDLHGIAYADGWTPIAVGDAGSILRRDSPTVGTRYGPGTASRARGAGTSFSGIRFRSSEGLPVDAAGRGR